MFTTRDVIKAFGKAAGGWINGASSIITFGSLALALRPTLRLWLPKMWVFQTAWFWMIVYALAVLTFAMNTIKRALNEQVARVEKNFYDFDFNARRDKTHRVFYHLHKEGENLRNGSAEARQAWDRKVVRALEEHSSPACIANYFIDTNRPNYQTERAVLQDDLFPNAMEHLEAILSERFLYYIR